MTLELGLDPDAMFTLEFPDMTFSVPKGVEAFRERLHAAFPEERKAVDAFLTTVGDLAAGVDAIPDRLALRQLPDTVWHTRGLVRHARSTLGGYLDTLHPSPRLRAVLCWLNGTCALPPSRLSLITYARVVSGYLQGSYYPCGGGSAITQELARVIREHGGEVELGTEVSSILVNDGAVRGVRVRPASLDVAPEPARDILAPVVVSAMDIKRTFLDLLPASAVSPTLLRRVRGYEMALPLFVVYLVLDRDLRAQGHPNTTTMLFEGDDLEAMYADAAAGETLPGVGASVIYASLADPDNPRLCRPGQTNLQLMTVDTARHDVWGAFPGGGRTRRYEARTQQLRDRLVSLADRDIPGIAASIAFETTATPIAEERYMRCSGGTSYGIAATPRQSMLGRPGPKTPISGLFLAGASTRTAHGLVGTLNGGVAAAAAVTGVPVAELLATTSRAAASVHPVA